MLLEPDMRPGGERPWLGQYILDDNNIPVPESDTLVWGRFMQDDERRRVGGAHFPRTGSTWLQPFGPHVSTVFLGLDHNFHNQGPPILFETMIFGHKKYGNEYQTRCPTWAEAEEMHALAIELLIHDHWLPDLMRNVCARIYNQYHDARVKYGVKYRRTDKWLSKFSSAASRTRSALRRFWSTRFGRTPSDPET